MDTPDSTTDLPGDGFAEALGVLEDAADGFVACDSAFRILFLNSEAERLCGKPKAELPGTTPWESSSDLGGTELECESRRVMAERVPAAFEYYHRSLALWLEVRVSPGPWGGISIWFRDITGRKRATEKLLASEAALERHLAELERIYADAPVGLAALDADLRYLRINRRLAEINGLPPAEHIGRTISEVLPNLAPILVPLLRAVLETGAPIVDVEIPGHTLARPGVQRHWLASLYPVRTAGNKVVGINVMLQEITERKHFERALQEKTDELKEAQRLAGVGSWTWDLESDTVTWSEQLRRLAAGDPAQITDGHKGFERYHTPESWMRLLAAGQRANEDGTPYEVEVEAILPDGQHRWRIVRGEVQRDASGRIVKQRGTAQDITRRKRAEEKLRMAHAELSAIHAHAPMVFLVVDEDLRVRKVNETAARFAGRPEADMLGLRPGGSLGCLNSLKDPKGCGYGPDCGTCPLRLAVLDSIRNRARHDNVEAWLPVRGSEGTEERCFLAFTAPMQLAGAQEALICALDITDRKRAEKALRDNEHWLNESQRISRIGSYVLDCAAGTWTSSETLDEIFGIGADYARTVEGWRALVHPEHHEEMMDHFTNEVLQQGKPFDREYRIVRAADGQVRWVHGRGAVVRDPAGAPRFMAGTVQDVTARRRVEEELRQAQKLEGLGRLAGGIAHDFNNLLTVINGYGDMLLGELKDEDPLHEPIAEIRKAGERAAKLTGQLLAFSRKQIVQPQLLDLNELIGEDLNMIQRLAGEDIELETRLAAPLGRVLADPGQMHQVLLNLVVNARDAMPLSGRLTIATSDVDVAEGDPARHPGLAPGRYVLLSVEDTGIGIEAEAREHIFDPFFTTKDKGAGTGLGLATVHGIVQQAGGAISFHSESGRGTTFLIHLPRSEAATPDDRGTVGSSADRGGTETVLVVEDQDSVRKLAVRMLRHRGYRILEAAHGDEALELAERYSGPIHLLLTDVVMPGMTGRKLAEHLKAARPSMKVLYMSGYAEDIVTSRGLLDPGLFYIAKPFAPEALAEKVREALGPAAAPAAARILVVDDELGVRTFLQKVLADAGYTVLVAEDGGQALKMVRAQRFDLVLTDLVMPEKEGIEIIRSMHKELPDLKIIAMSGAFGGEFLKVAKRLGANSTLAKPVAPEQLISAVRGVLG
jgi:PAS domain S-box-containing protein